MAKIPATHGYQTVSADFRYEILFDGELFDQAHQLIENSISRLGQPDPSDPDDRDMAYMIFRVPEGSDYGDGHVDFKEFMQCIGSDDGVTVEIKRRNVEPDWPKGVLRLYVVGKPEAANEPEESAEVEGIGAPVPVRPSEVLSKAEAIDLFTYYYDHDTVPDGWHLRERPDFADFSGAHTRFIPYK